MDERFPTRRYIADCPLLQSFDIILLAIDLHRPFFHAEAFRIHGHCPASPLLRPHPTTAFAFASCSSPKFLAELSKHAAPFDPPRPRPPNRVGNVVLASRIRTRWPRGFVLLTSRYVGGSLALRLTPSSDGTRARRSPSARPALLITCRFLCDSAPFS